MINNVVLVGRLTKEPELKKTQNNKSILEFTLAVERRFGKESADFIRCVVWNQPAEYLSRYAKKGSIVGVEGSIQTDTYDNKNGERVNKTTIAVNNVKLLSYRKEEVENEDKYEPPIPEKKKADAIKFGDGFIESEDLPFY